MVGPRGLREAVHESQKAHAAKLPVVPDLFERLEAAKKSDQSFDRIVRSDTGP
jgi:hypothetical protein